jgi:P-type Ca2+ transporter type 2C
MDPLRPGIKDAVEQCKRSGINIRMVTGDNLDTAIAISKEAGIISDSDLLENE